MAVLPGLSPARNDMMFTLMRKELEDN